ncbi:MAG TPA: hypothetical protein P5572_05705 [Phycisphaerae bacterium]|nr:hypothetical protein [Phycisphaerales bacterium]HRX84497.1 hypothetical protein [Phycisphaerae bacterium]
MTRHTSNRTARHGVVALGLLATTLAGCVNESSTIRALQERVTALETDRQRCTQALADRDAIISDLRRRVGAEPAFEGINLDDLFTVDRIEIVSQTGGASFDNQPGDDGVIVYVRPLDADGDFLKAAGQFTIQLLDLTHPGAPRSLATYVFSKKQELAAAWYGGLLTNHYTFRCAFPPRLNPRPPREVQVRVVMLDWLTGREFSDTRTVHIERIDPENTVAPASTQ